MPRTILLLVVVTFLSCTDPGADSPGATDDEVPADGRDGVFPVSAPVPGAWQHRTLTDLDVDVSRFRPTRARYLQVMYDLDGREEVQSRGIVHIDIDPVVHSGPWDGRLPAVIEPLREPGLRVVWQIQNALYSAFDRVQTGATLSVKQRVMPAGTTGLIVGEVVGDTHERYVTSAAEDRETASVARTPLPDGAANVLTLPYILAGMELQPGDRFTLPGYALIGGPEGRGTPWTAAVRVISEGERSLKGSTVPFTEVLLLRMDAANGLSVDQVDYEEVGRRITRLIVSREPPYLLGRADVTMSEGGSYVYVREFLGLVDWAAQPLPISDLTDPTLWDLDLQAGTMTLRAERVPPVIVEPSPNGSDSPSTP